MEAWSLFQELAYQKINGIRTFEKDYEIRLNYETTPKMVTVS